MYATSLNEDKYVWTAGVRRLNNFRIGQRVLYSGKTNYSYDNKNIATKQIATIITKSEFNVVIELDNYNKPYRTGTGVDVIPPRQYAVITEGDLACGSKLLEDI